MNRYSIVILPSAKRDIKRIDPQLKQRIFDAIDSLKNQPRPTGALKLAGAGEQYRIRIGEYRVIYSIQDAVLTVLLIRIRRRDKAYR